METSPDTELSIRLEHHITDEWAARAILKVEGIIGDFVDPCTGTGILHRCALEAGYNGIALDIHDWGYPSITGLQDFLKLQPSPFWRPKTYFMNPPFSLACEFVEKAFELGASKVICFHSFSWWTSNEREGFWEQFPPTKVYVCADRATCWRYDIPINERGKRYNPETGKELSSTPTTYAWFVFERGSPHGTLLGHVRKGAA